MQRVDQTPSLVGETVLVFKTLLTINKENLSLVEPVLLYFILSSIYYIYVHVYTAPSRKLLHTQEMNTNNYNYTLSFMVT